MNDDKFGQNAESALDWVFAMLTIIGAVAAFVAALMYSL